MLLHTERRRGVQGPTRRVYCSWFQQTDTATQFQREGGKKPRSSTLIDMLDAGKLLAEPAVISPALHGGLNAALMPLTSPPLQQVLHLKVDHTG